MVKALLKHLFPRRVLKGNLSLAYTLGLGGGALTSLLVLIASGLLLLCYYSAAPDGAYASIQFLESDVWGGRYLRSLHRLSSHALLLLVALHALRVVLTGAFLRRSRLNWLVGCLLLFVAVFEAYTGYLLPRDQLAYWATQTGMQLLQALPAGPAARALLVPDGVGGRLTLLRFQALHVALLPLALVALSMLHFFVIRRQRGLLPYGPPGPHVGSSPHLFRLVKLGAGACVAALLVGAALVPAPLELPADPAHPPNPAKSAWFLLWIQELVSHGTPAVYVAVLLVALFVALPWLPVPPLERAAWFPREQRLVAVLVLAASALVLALTTVALFFRGADWRLSSPF